MLGQGSTSCCLKLSVAVAPPFPCLNCQYEFAEPCAKTLDEVFNIVHTSMYSPGFQTRLVDSLVTLVSMIRQAA